MNKTITEQGRKIAQQYGYLVSAANTILSPGKFEGEHVSTLYFWEASLNGDGEHLEHYGDEVTIFPLSPDEQAHLNTHYSHFTIYEREDGFVIGGFDDIA